MAKKIVSLMLFLIISTVFTLADAAEPPSIRWQEWSRDIFSQAQKEHKLILIYGRVSWCHWCQRMDAYSFQDPAVVQFVQAHYVPVRIDLERNQALSSRYQISGFPTVLIVNADNQVLKRYAGYTTASGLLRRLKQSAPD